VLDKQFNIAVMSNKNNLNCLFTLLSDNVIGGNTSNFWTEFDEKLFTKNAYGFRFPFVKKPIFYQQQRGGDGNSVVMEI
jgi:hypothetical protein